MGEGEHSEPFRLDPLKLKLFGQCLHNKNKMASILLFTDPACMGKLKDTEGQDTFTEDGDVDDIANLILQGQLYGTRLIVVICGRRRFKPFMQVVGNAVRDTYGCTFIQEEELDIQLQGTQNIVYVHAPTQSSSAAWMERNLPHIGSVYRQGDDQSVNFKNSPEMRAVLAKAPTTLYRTQDTDFTIDYDVKVDQYLDGLSQKIYRDYFEFAYRKKFGLAIHLPYCDRLYSDTGKNGEPGNGILEYLPILARLPPLVLPDRLEQALLNTIRSTDETSLVNARNIVGVLNLYCDYASLIVDDKLPHMGNLKSLDQVTKWADCPDFVKAFFENVRLKSTPLFDFASGYWSTLGQCPREELQRAVVASLKQFHYDMLD
jgi:hypothetical protein